MNDAEELEKAFRVSRQAEMELEAAVVRARFAGMSWEEVARHTGYLGRDGARKRFFKVVEQAEAQREAYRSHAAA